MTNESNLYKYLKSLNLIVFSIEDDTNEIETSSLSHFEIANINTEILNKYYGNNAVKKKYLQLLYQLI